jgi:HK97 gp10 family phage protein
MSAAVAIDSSNNYDKIKTVFTKEAIKFDEMVADELDRIGSLMQERASMDAPVDTGYMASHIEKENTGKDTVTVVATAEYSGYVDQGTSKMAANPFFSRNVEIIQTQEIPNIEKNIGVKIEADFAVVR